VTTGSGSLAATVKDRSSTSAQLGAAAMGGPVSANLNGSGSSAAQVGGTLH